MLKFIAPRLPTRTTAAHLRTIDLDNGCSKLIFNCPNTRNEAGTGSQYLVTNHLAPAPLPPADPNTPNSSLCPPFHIHLKEDETFHVISGIAKFLLLDQCHQGGSRSASKSANDGITTQIAETGSTVTIPRGQIHTFRNASTSRALIIEFGFSPPYTSVASASNVTSYDVEKAQLNTKMHRFFRNTQLYRSDCAVHKLPRSLPQVLLFNHQADVALVPLFLLNLHHRYPTLRSLIERFIAPTLGRLMNVLGGVFLGQWLFGFQSSYQEYYDPGRGQIRPEAKADSKDLAEKAGKQKST